MLLENMKWPEVGRIDFNKTIVIQPLGSLEQHGPHLGVTTDTDIVTALARAIEAHEGDGVLLTPTMWLGHSPHHMKFPGTISAEPRVYIDVVKALVRSMVHHGARRIFLLNGHGGNEAPVPIALRELKTEFSHIPDLFVTFASYWWLAGKALKEIRESGMGGVGHACEMETSVMLAIQPHKVDMALARKAGPGAAMSYRVIDMQASNPVAIVNEFHELSDTGVLGEPELATAAKGQKFLAAFVEAILPFLADFRTWTPEMIKGHTTSGSASQ
ncbi:MAG: creatininase family protein [Bryobacterales bacterium]|nr:creatininase family protein [Bryobacterales bacterium]